MYFLVFILILLTLFILMLFYELVSIKLNTNMDELNLDLNWFHSFLQVQVQVHIINYSSYISIYLFGKRIYSKANKKMSGKRKIKRSYVTALIFHNVYADVYYGLNNPFSTGITSGIIQIIQSYFNGIYIAQFPDFLPEKEYMYINAGAKLNIGKSIANVIRIKLNKEGKRRKLSWINSI